MSQEPSKARTKADAKKERKLSEKEQAIMGHVNSVIQQSVALVMDALTSTCKCSGCTQARAMAPHVRAFFQFGQTIRKVEMAQP